MWIFTTGGFISAVRNPNDRTIVVRSRDKASLTPISKATKADIRKTPLADYPYRLEIGHDQFAEWVKNQVLNINYKNFKSEVALTKGRGFATALTKVWSTMHEIEDAKARERISE